MFWSKKPSSPTISSGLAQSVSDKVQSSFDVAEKIQEHLPYVERRVGDIMNNHCFLGQSLVDVALKKGFSASKEEAIELFDVLLRTGWVKKLVGKYRMTGAPALTDYYIWQGKEGLDLSYAINIMEEAKLQNIVKHAIKTRTLDVEDEWFRNPKGWVHKRGEMNTSYKKRYMELRGKELRYFKSDKDTKIEQGNIDLSKIETVTLPPEKQIGDKVHCLGLNSLGRTYIFGFDSKTEQLRWTSVLLDIVQSLRGGRRSSAASGADNHLAAANRALIVKSSSVHVDFTDPERLNPWEVGSTHREPTPYEAATGNMSEENISFFNDHGLNRWPFFVYLSLAALKEDKGMSKYDRPLFHEIFSKYFQWDYLMEGKTIFTDGENHQIFHIVIKGAVEVSTRSADGGVITKSNFKRNIHTLLTGAWFGELMFGDIFIKVCRARTVSDTLLLSISHESMLALISKYPDCKKTFDDILIQKIQHCVGNVPIFGFLEETDGSNSKAYQLSQLFTIQQFPPNTVIYKQGEFGHSLFVIIEGLVEILVEDIVTDGKAENQRTSLGTLGENDCFGETSLINDLPRSQTVQTITWVTLIELTKEKFDNFLLVAPELKAPIEMAVQGRLAESLKKIKLFAALNESSAGRKLDLLGSLAEYQKVPPGSIILEQGVPGHAFFVLLHGRARVKAHREGAEPKVLRELSSGDSFGEISLLDPTITTTAEVSAITESLLLKLPNEKFQTFLRLMPELIPEFTKVIEKLLHNDMRSLRASIDNSVPLDSPPPPSEKKVLEEKKLPPPLNVEIKKKE